MKIQHCIVLLFLWISGYSVSAQETPYTFKWRNQAEQKQAGKLVIGVMANPSLGEVKLTFNVEWLNSQGRPIVDDSQKPLLYLSEYEIETTGNTSVFCKTFKDQNKFDLYFSDTASLVFGYSLENTNQIELHFKMQYAFGTNEILEGTTKLIDYPQGNSLILVIPSTKLIPKIDPVKKEVLGDPSHEVLDLCHDIDSCIAALQARSSAWQLKIDSLDYQQRITQLHTELSSPNALDSTRMNQIRDELSMKSLEITTMIDAIDSIRRDIRLVKERFSNDLLPTESLLLYQGRIQSIANTVNAFQFDFFADRGRIASMQKSIGVPNIPNDLSEQRELLIDTFFPIFEKQIDSLKELGLKHEVLLRNLGPLLAGLSSKAIGNLVLDSLINFHYFLKGELDEISISHKSSYQTYRIGIQETGRIATLDDLHLNFEEIYSTKNAQFRLVDENIREMERKVDNLKTNKDNTLLWIGGGILLIVLFILLIASNRNARRRSRQVMAVNGSGEQSNGISSDYEVDVLNGSSDYYPFDVPEVLGSVVQEVHFSFRAIKAMNQIIQGAISRKTPTEFGGYFFGRQEHAVGKRQGQHIIMVDQVISSSTLRPLFQADIAAGEDLVDEMDKVVSQNKRLALLGWFSSSEKDEIEMGEDLMKLHRTFFRDKWHIALLVNPISDNLKSSIFLRRKSGFFEPKPGSDCQFSLEDLYQYSLNPPIVDSLKSGVKYLDSDYKGIVLNENWCDSIVQKVNFHNTVIESIHKELGEERYKLRNQIASGFLYGAVEIVEDDNGNNEFLLYVDTFLPATNGDTPRELPGVALLGWLSLSEQEIFESLKLALPYHEKYFRRVHQISMIVNMLTKEFRIFSKKHSRELNNNSIETEEFNLNDNL